MAINENAILDFKLAAYMAEEAGTISIDERNFLLEFVDEMYEYIDMYDTRGDSYTTSRAAEVHLTKQPHGAKRDDRSNFDYDLARSQNELMKKTAADRASGLQVVKNRVNSKIRKGKAQLAETKMRLQTSAEERRKRRAELAELRKLQKKQPKTSQDRSRIAFLSNSLGAVAEYVQEFFVGINEDDAILERAYTLDSEEREGIDILFPMTECFFAKDNDGYYCYTTEARSFSYPTIEEIPVDAVEIVSIFSQYHGGDIDEPE